MLCHCLNVSLLPSLSLCFQLFFCISQQHILVLRSKRPHSLPSLLKHSMTEKCSHILASLSFCSTASVDKAASCNYIICGVTGINHTMLSWVVEFGPGESLEVRVWPTSIDKLLCVGVCTNKCDIDLLAVTWPYASLSLYFLILTSRGLQQMHEVTMMPTSCTTISMSWDLAERWEPGCLLSRASTSVSPLMVLHTSATASEGQAESREQHHERHVHLLSVTEHFNETPGPWVLVGVRAQVKAGQHGHTQSCQPDDRQADLSACFGDQGWV